MDTNRTNLQIVVSVEEKKMIQIAAKISDMSLSEYMKHIVLPSARETVEKFKQEVS